MGSGKGYLSQDLSLQHGLTVVGMDSQSTNTDGALKRNRKVRCGKLLWQFPVSMYIVVLVIPPMDKIHDYLLRDVICTFALG